MDTQKSIEKIPPPPPPPNKNKNIFGFASFFLLGYLVGVWFPSAVVPNLPATKDWLQTQASLHLFKPKSVKEQTPRSCKGQRKIVENVVSATTCQRLINLANSVKSLEEVGDELSGTNIHQLVAIADVLDKNDLGLLNQVRYTMQDVVSKHFDLPTLIEYTHLTSRLPGKSDYSHGLHADQCFLNLQTGSCIERDESCCAWRSHSALLYLNDHGKDYEGGEFIFKDSLDWQKDDPCFGPDTIIQPKCGTLVMFSSGKVSIIKIANSSCLLVNRKMYMELIESPVEFDMLWPFGSPWTPTGENMTISLSL